VTVASRVLAGLALALLPLPRAAAGAEAPRKTGIDVSHHSGEIDWQAVARHGFDFVFVKATEGIDDGDPSFELHWDAVGELGVARGAYHFFVTEDDPEAQARFFLSKARFRPGDLPPVVDVEVLGHGTTGDVSEKLLRFLEIVEAECGATPVIYTNARFWDTHFTPTFGRYPLWIAEYDVESPTLPAGWDEWTIWQFEGDAAVPRIEKGAARSRLRDGLSLEGLRIPEAARP